MSALKLKIFAVVAMVLFVVSPLALGTTSQELLQTGLDNIEKQNFVQAIQDFTKVIKLNPDNFPAFVGRGSAKGSLGDWTGAIQDYTTALKLKPDFTGAYILRGVVKSANGDYTGANQDFEKAKQLCLNQEDMEGYKKAIDAQKQFGIRKKH